MYYKCEFDGKEQTTNHYNNLYFIKPLDLWGKNIMLEYRKEYRDSTDTNTLGNRISLYEIW